MAAFESVAFAFALDAVSSVDLVVGQPGSGSDLVFADLCLVLAVGRAPAGSEHVGHSSPEAHRKSAEMGTCH